MGKNSVKSKAEKNQAGLRVARPDFRQAQPLTQTQHLVNGLIIILVLFILTVAGLAVTNWYKASLETGQVQNDDFGLLVEGSLDDQGGLDYSGQLDAVGPKALARKSQLLVGMDDIVEIINPLYSSGDGEKDLVALLFESLIVLTDEGQPTKLLAESWHYDDDSQQLSFQLSQGHFFRDGRALGANDVVFTYQCLMADSYNGPLKGRFFDIASVEAAGENNDQVIFTFNHNVQEPDYRLFTIGILKEDHYLDVADRVFEIFDRKISPEGSGNFEVSLLEEERVEINLRPGYASEVKQIIFQKVEAQDKFNLLQEGELDIVRSRWDSRLEIRAGSLPAYAFYPLDSRIEFYLLAGNRKEDSDLYKSDYRLAIIKALAGYDLNSHQEDLLQKSRSDQISCYYFKGVDDQVDLYNLEQVQSLAQGLDGYPLCLEAQGKDWPELATLLENGDYELLLLPAPANNRLPEASLLLDAKTNISSDFDGAIAWPAAYVAEAIVVNARILQIDINKNVYPLSVSSAGWTQRVENIRLYQVQGLGQ